MSATLQTAPPACERKAASEVRGQTRGFGPTRRQKRWLSRSKTVESRLRSHKRAFTRFAGRRPQAPAQASLEASLDDSAPQGAGRPCYEAGNSACSGEWRREAGSPARARLMSAWERESGELPAPNLPPFGRKTGRGLFVLRTTLPAPPLILILILILIPPRFRLPSLQFANITHSREDFPISVSICVNLAHSSFGCGLPPCALRVAPCRNDGRSVPFLLKSDINY